MHLNGITIHTDIRLTIPEEDWSRVRSPSRAIRRIRRGYRQNIRYYEAPDPTVYSINGKLYMHPVTMHHLGHALQRRSAA